MHSRKRLGSDNRKRGRAGQADRKRRLKAHPVCAECEKEGKVRKTDIIDHIIPLAFGGEDTDENTQGLCNWHNAIKTAAENASAGGGAAHPAWLERPKSPVLVVAGPPCGGKSTFAARLAKPGDVIIDLDEIATEIDPSWKRQWSPELLNKALRIRNAMLGEAAKRPIPNGGRIILVVGAPTDAERQWWIDRLGATLLVRDPGQEEATRRAIARDGRGDHVEAYYRRRALPWSPKKPPRKRTGSDEDGFPIEP